MLPDHESCDTQVERQCDTRSPCRMEHPVSSRKERGGDDRAERDVTRQPYDNRPRSEDDRECQWRQAEHHSRGGGHALPPTKPDKYREDMTGDRRQPAPHREVRHRHHPRPEHQHGDGALEDIEQPDRYCRLPAHHTIEVGRPQVLAAMLSQIDAAKPPTRQVTGRDRPKQIGSHQPGCDAHHSSSEAAPSAGLPRTSRPSSGRLCFRAPRAVKRRRSGAPLNPQAARKPWCR